MKAILGLVIIVGIAAGGWWFLQNKETTEPNSAAFAESGSFSDGEETFSGDESAAVSSGGHLNSPAETAGSSDALMSKNSGNVEVVRTLTINPAKNLSRTYVANIPYTFVTDEERSAKMARKKADQYIQAMAYLDRACAHLAPSKLSDEKLVVTEEAATEALKKFKTIRARYADFIKTSYTNLEKVSEELTTDYPFYKEVKGICDTITALRKSGEFMTFEDYVAMEKQVDQLTNDMFNVLTRMTPSEKTLTYRFTNWKSEHFVATETWAPLF